MRAIVAGLLALALSALTAVAGDVWAYTNARFGYSIDVPASFAVVRDSDNGDGRAYRDGATKLLVWGANIAEGDFEAAAHAASSFATADGWSLTYEAITPSWASISGAQGQRILYQRMIATCDGQYAAFRLEYSAVELAKLDPVVNGLVRSLKGGC